MHCRMLSTLPSGCDNQRCLQTLPNIPWCAKPPRSRTSGLGVELSADAVVPGAQVGSASRRPTSRPQTRPLPPGPPPQPNGPYCLNRFSTATKPVCFRGRKTSLGSLRPLPSLRPVPGGQEALPAARGHSAPPPLPPPDSLLASCMRVPLTVSEGQASAPLLSASGKNSPHAIDEGGNLGLEQNHTFWRSRDTTAAEPGLSRGLRTPVPCSFPVSRRSAFCEPNQVQELPGAGVGGGRRARNQDSSCGSTRGPPTTGGGWGRGTRESQRCGASSRGQADSRGSGTWRSGPWKALLPTEITFSISRLSLQTETSVAQPQAPVMSPFLFSLDC